MNHILSGKETTIKDFYKNMRQLVLFVSLMFMSNCMTAQSLDQQLGDFVLSGNLRGGIEFMENEAKKGKPEAQYLAGLLLFQCKDSTLINKEKALYWFRKAAEQEYPDAYYSLGYCYEKGNGVKQDYEYATKYYEKAAQYGITEAEFIIGTYYIDGFAVKKDYTKGVEYLTKAANKNDPEAQYNLARCYHYGYGVKIDLQKAFALYEKAANQGLAPAQYNVGIMYIKGVGTFQSEAFGRRWIRLAADQGMEEAQMKLKELNK